MYIYVWGLMNSTMVLRTSNILFIHFCSVFYQLKILLKLCLWKSVFKWKNKLIFESYEDKALFSEPLVTLRICWKLLLVVSFSLYFRRLKHIFYSKWNSSTIRIIKKFIWFMLYHKINTKEKKNKSIPLSSTKTA